MTKEKEPILTYVDVQNIINALQDKIEKREEFIKTLQIGTIDRETQNQIDLFNDGIRELNALIDKVANLLKR